MSTQQPHPDTIHAEQCRLAHAHPQAILQWAHQRYAQRLVVVTSLQITGIVALHMLRQITGDVQALIVDTDLLFPETYQLIETVEQVLDLHIQRVRPAYSLSEQVHRHGAELWTQDADLCCEIRKVQPLQQALSAYDAWVTGIRRDQSTTREQVPVLAWDQQYNLLKLMPFANWTESMLWTYIHAHDLPYNPLHDRGYESIGCHTCTVAGNRRNGRWAHQPKTECGIHKGTLTPRTPS
ncbi:MAG: phosphoadenylyl-sulfate reductase [Anaerolineae bacterium]